MTDRAPARLVTAAMLRRWPLPVADAGDKEDRGSVLIVGGAPEMPGAVILAATAALRAGAGKLQIATTADVARLVAAEIPEARVFALPATRGGAIAPAASTTIVRLLGRAAAALIGPGMVDERTSGALMRRVLQRRPKGPLVVDAIALTSLAGAGVSWGDDVVITPHAGEMASLRGVAKAAVERDQRAVARRTSRELRLVVALKGAETFIAAPGGRMFRNTAGNDGLATSGSGDVLAGVIAGLLARGADPLRATVWGVHAHALAGERLARSVGPIGYLARELPAEIPAVLAELG